PRSRRAAEDPARDLARRRDWACRSLPFERPFHPLIDEPDRQHAEKYDHRPETVDPDITERNRPRKQEGDLQIENDEQDRDEVIADIEAHPRVLERVEAAFVGRQL